MRADQEAIPPGPESEGPRAGEGARAEIATGGTVSEDDSAPVADERKAPWPTAALALARSGLPVFPCWNMPGSDRHKAPLTLSGFHSATTDEAIIMGWARKYPEALIGVPTGTASGLAVLDLDKKNGKDGYAAVPDWETLSPAIVRTGSGGAHLYFQAEGQVRCSTGKDGVDVRGEGGYVIVPPSEGYTWHREADLSRLPPFPAAYRPRDYVAAPNDELLAEEVAELAAAVRSIPNVEVDWGFWKQTIGMGLWGATGGSDEGLELFHEWSAKHTAYDPQATDRAWAQITRSPPVSIGAGTIFHLASEADPDWRDRYWRTVETAALGQLNGNGSDWLAGIAVEPPPVVEEPQGGQAAPSPPEKVERPPSTMEDAEADEPPKVEVAEPPPSQPTALGEWNAGADDWSGISPRAWLLGNTYCRRFVSSLIAPGGAGKTAFRLLQAMALATGKNLTGEHVFRRSRVLFVSLEDDRDELRRRVQAAMIHHNIAADELDGWLFLSAPEGKAGKLLEPHPRTRRPVDGSMKTELDKAIRANRIDVLILDPLVKAHDVEENDNSAMDAVISLLANLAVAHDIAVDVLHHTSKGAADPGNAERGRGASAVNNGARLVYTLTQMTGDEAARFGIAEGERRSFVRVDSGKVNITPPLSQAKWFRLVGVPLGNGAGDYPNGDNVQTVEPWNPPDAWEGVTDDMRARILAEIDAGIPADPDRGIAAGSRYSAHPNAKTRAAWPIVARHVPDRTDKQCKEIIKALLGANLIVEKAYHDPSRRGDQTGLFVVTERERENVPM